MRPLLEARGHRVVTPDLEMLDAATSIDDHAQQVIDAMHGLTDVVLAGHSYAGLPVAVVADRVPEQLAHVVYVDSWAPFDGESGVDQRPELGESMVPRARDGLLPPIPPEIAGADEADYQLLRDGLTVTPLRCWTDPIHLTGSGDLRAAHVRPVHALGVRQGRRPAPDGRLGREGDRLEAHGDADAPRRARRDPPRGRRRLTADLCRHNWAVVSPAVDNLVAQLSKLPGVGQRTAQRLAFHLLSRPKAEALSLAEAIQEVKERVRFCDECGNLTEEERCGICRDARRDHALICVVEQPQDLVSLERTHEYRGLYHVLGGSLSPLDGVEPEHLRIDELLKRVERNGVQEVVLATNPNMTGEATAAFLADRLRGRVRVTRLASGLPVGGDLEYADEVTLGRALAGRREMQ